MHDNGEPGKAGGAVWAVPAVEHTAESDDAGQPRQPPPDSPAPGGFLYQLIVWPARVVAIVVVLPLRLLWELFVVLGRALRRMSSLLSAGLRLLLWDWFLRPVLLGLRVVLWDWFMVPVGRFLRRFVLRPAVVAVRFLVRYLVVSLRFLIRYLLVVPIDFLWTYLLVLPLQWLGRQVLTPLARMLVNALRVLWKAAATVADGIGRAVRFLVRAFVYVLLWQWVLRPAGMAVRFLAHYLLAVPISFLWTCFLVAMRWFGRQVLVPIIRIFVAALGYAWRFAWWIILGVVTAVWMVVYLLVVLPARWAWRTLLVPTGLAVAAGVRFALRVTAVLARRIAHVVGVAFKLVLIRPLVWAWRVLGKPVVQAIRVTWTTLVVAPARWMNQAIWQPTRQATREAVRSLFRRPADPNR